MIYELSKTQCKSVLKFLPEIMQDVLQFFKQDPRLQNVEISKENDIIAVVNRQMFPELDEKLLASTFTRKDVELLISVLYKSIEGTVITNKTAKYASDLIPNYRV